MNKLSTPIPPGELINLVAGHTNADIFAASREPSLRDTLLPRLHECGVPLQGRMRILDFGCGCGRLLAAWEHFRTPSMTLNGIDINPQLVAFCRQHIPFAEVTETNFLPPTRFDDETFDFAYAVSVFTHLKLAPAMMWAGEFARIVRPGGTFVVTYHGVYFERALRAQSPTLADLLKNRGYHTVLHVPENETFKGSNQYGTYHTAAFITSLFKGFELLKIFDNDHYDFEGKAPPGGGGTFCGWQDMAIFRRSPD